MSIFESTDSEAYLWVNRFNVYIITFAYLCTLSLPGIYFTEHYIYKYLADMQAFDIMMHICVNSANVISRLKLEKGLKL